MIEFEHVSLRLGDFFLDDCSLSINKHDYYVIMGPSGAGKTILLELIAGLHKPDEGVIWIAGKNAAEIPLEKRKIGIVYQDYALFPHMTVEENICYGMKQQGISKAEQKICCEKLLEKFGIMHLRKRKPLTLSGGEAQRTALARALAVKPDILLMDEPFSALDPITQKQCMDDVKKLHQEGMTIVQVTHSRNEAQLLATKSAIIREGKIIQEGSAENIFLHPHNACVAEFLGFENIISGKIFGMEKTVCVRSEDILIHRKKISENFLCGKIISTELKGALRTCQVDAGEIFTITMGKREGDYAIGEEVFLEISLNSIHQLS